MADRDRRDAPTDSRDTVVVDRDRGGPGGVVAVIVGLVVLVLIIWLIMAMADTTEDTLPDTTTPNNIEADIDADVIVPDDGGDEEVEGDTEEDGVQ